MSPPQWRPFFSSAKAGVTACLRDVCFTPENVGFTPKADISPCPKIQKRTSRYASTAVEKRLLFGSWECEPRSSTQCMVFAGSASANVRIGSLAEMATNPLSTIRRHGQWRSGIGLRARHGQCLGCGPRGRISARRGRHLVLDVPPDRLRFCNVLVNLFLLGSELLLRGGKMLLLASELLYAALQHGEISCHASSALSF